MSEIMVADFQYPCAYTTMKQTTKFWFSNTNKNGHFNIPKLIWGNGRVKSVGSYLDIKGECGLTQFTYAIVDEPNNLTQIKQAFDSDEFRELMRLCSVGDMSINRKVIATFRKDFYKQFLND